MSTPKFSLKGPFASNFTNTNLEYAYTKDNGNVMVTYKNSFKGTDYVHVRELWWDGKCWVPGKGSSFDPEFAQSVIEALTYTVHGRPKKLNAPKSDALKAAATKRGLKVVEIPLAEADPLDLRGLPKLAG